MPTSLRRGPSIGHQLGRVSLASLPGDPAWKELALAAAKDANTCDRDVSMKATPHVKAVMAKLDTESREKLSKWSKWGVKVLAAKKKAATQSMSTLVDDLPGV